MSDDLDKFVLQYSVELKDSIKRLEKLQTAMDKTEKTSGKASTGVKDFASGAAGELDRMVPGISKLTSAVSGLGGEFAIAASAVAALGVGIKSVMDLQSQFNQQRQVGMQLGVSGVRVEDYQRAFAKGSGGRVSREAALENIQGFSSNANDAFKDLSGAGRMKAMKYGGVDVGSFANPTGINDELKQYATFLQGKSGAEVESSASVMGVSKDFALTLQKIGPAIGDMNQMTQAEITLRQQSEDSLAKFNTELGQFKADINELEISLGEKLLPAADKFVGAIAAIVDAMNKLTSPNAPAKGKIVNGHFVPDAPEADPTVRTYNKGLYEIRNGRRVNLPDPLTPAQIAAQTAKSAEATKKENEAKNNFADNLDADQKSAAQLANQQALAIAAFSSAVGTFSGAVSQAQAIAAWAGNVGQQGGVKGASGTASGSRGLKNNNPGNLEYTPFAKAHGATGTDGRFAIFPSMEAGVAAHAALLDSGYYSQGLDTPRKIIDKYAPAKENDQGAYLSFLKSRGFDPDKVITDKAGFNAAQMQYESGYGRKGIGQSPGAGGTVGTSIAYNAVAQILGVDPVQLRTGGISRSDTEFGLDNAERGALNSEQIARQHLASGSVMTNVQRGQFNDQIRNAQQLIAAMESNRTAMLAAASGNSSFAAQRPGAGAGVPITINSTINVAGAGEIDAAELARRIDAQLNTHLSNALNSITNGISG